MQDAQPSRTALRVAMRRAAHQLLDTPRVLEDPVALTILGADAAAELRRTLDHHDAGMGRPLRAFLVARSRVAEDELARGVGRGAKQFVVLGAGLDTFAYRNPHAGAGLRVFEVDHPATQAWKRQLLAEGRIAIPESVTFAPVDFERQTLADGLAAAGFDAAAPAFFSWLGVTMYLSDDAIASTLDFVAALPSGGGIVFDYVVPRSSLSFKNRLVFDAIATRVAAAGESFRTFFDPAELRARLTALGFSEITDLTGDALNARYFAQRSDGLKVGGALGRIVSAVK